MKNVKCIRNGPKPGQRKPALTYGKVYEVDERLSRRNMYYIVDDEGRGVLYAKNRFVDEPNQPVAPPLVPNMVTMSQAQQTAAFAEVFGKIEFTKTRHGCKHEWTHYVGIREEYDFCTVCDTKKF